MSGIFSRIGLLFGSIAFCAAIALPVDAADREAAHTMVHRGVHHSSLGGFTRAGDRFAAGASVQHRTRYGHGAFAEGRYAGEGAVRMRDRRGHRFGGRDWVAGTHGRHLPMLALSGWGAARGSGILVIGSDRTADGMTGSYNGSIDAYRADGGTYVAGYSDGGFEATSAPLLRSRARIIDVAKAGDACAYESGVCVIRP